MVAGNTFASDQDVGQKAKSELVKECESMDLSSLIVYHDVAVLNYFTVAFDEASAGKTAPVFSAPATKKYPGNSYRRARDGLSWDN